MNKNQFFYVNDNQIHFLSFFLIFFFILKRSVHNMNADFYCPFKITFFIRFGGTVLLVISFRMKRERLTHFRRWSTCSQLSPKELLGCFTEEHSNFCISIMTMISRATVNICLNISKAMFYLNLQLWLSLYECLCSMQLHNIYSLT